MGISTRAGLALGAVALFGGAAQAQDEPAREPAERQPQWYDGFAITPGVGLRHMGFHVRRNSDGHYGTLSNSIPDSFFYALDIQSPSLRFSEHWGAALYAYTTNVELTGQFVAGEDGSNEGDTHDVGTRGSGSYSYLVPALQWGTGGNAGRFEVALGYGTWIADMSGDIILTPDNQPAAGMPSTPFAAKVSKTAYLFHMQWRTAGSWQVAMSVGGPEWDQDGFTYEAEEVSITVGYSITPRTFGAP